MVNFNRQRVVNINGLSTMGINYLYQRRSIVLWLIDGFYMIIGLGIAGMILGGWR